MEYVQVKNVKIDNEHICCAISNNADEWYKILKLVAENENP